MFCFFNQFQLLYADNQNNLVNRLATRRRLAIGEDWSQDVHFGEQSELRYSYHVFCDEYYFGDGCAEYCRPRDDTLGHYTCDEEGNRICLEGWKGNYCSERKWLLSHSHAQTHTQQFYTVELLNIFDILLQVHALAIQYTLLETKLGS